MMILKVCGDTFKALWRSRLIQIALFGTLLVLVLGGNLGMEQDTYLIHGIPMAKPGVVSEGIEAWQREWIFNGALFPFAEGMYFVLGVLISFDILAIFKDGNGELMMTSQLSLWKWFLGKIIAYYCVCMVIGYAEVWMWNIIAASGNYFDVSWREFFTPWFVFYQIKLFIILGTPGFFYYASLTMMGAIVSGNSVVGLLVPTVLNFIYVYGYRMFREALSFYKMHLYPAHPFIGYFFPFPSKTGPHYELWSSHLEDMLKTLGVWMIIIGVSLAVSYIAAGIRLYGIGKLKLRKKCACDHMQEI